MDFAEALAALRAEYEQLSDFLAQPDSYSRPDYAARAKRHNQLEKTVKLAEQRDELEARLSQARSMADDPELAELARAEIASHETALRAAQEALTEALQPRDPDDDRQAIVEIRAGTGGDEASLFAGDLYRMYVRYGERHGLKAELLGQSPSEAGGFKEVIFRLGGESVYGRLRYESGVHRVQRVPVTESQGRIHTSTATVAVLPEAEEADVSIDPKDLRVDVFRSSGHGGQSVNTTDSAVRLTHLPTGLVVTCQDEKSQIKNKEKALSVLRSRLLARQIEEQERQLAEGRRRLIGSAERSEKIRTYNFPQDRITDHRVNYSRSGLSAALDGDIDDLIEAVRGKA
jgi:peptide chain release factor 1